MTIFVCSRAEAAGVLGPRAGGGGKVLRWAAFLKAADDLDEPARPIPPPSQLPPPLAAPRFTCRCQVRRRRRRWSSLSGHALGGADARIMGRRGERDDRLRLATEAGGLRRVRPTSRMAYSTTAADEDNSEIARPSRLSPFLRWG